MANEVYDYHRYDLNTLTTLNPVALMGGNNARLTVIVASAVSGNPFGIAASQPAQLRDCFAFFVGPGMLVLPYRDYGPIIRGPLWAIVNTSTLNIQATEVFRVS